MFFSRSVDGQPQSVWERLPDHLAAVAARAAGFADAYGAAAWGEAAGRWHDLGKYSREFQDHLVTPSQVDHATAGAQHAAGTLPGPAGRLLAYAIAGHHAGLADAQAKTAGRTALADRLRKSVPDWSAAPATERAAPPALAAPQLDAFPPALAAALRRDAAAQDRDRLAFRLAFLGRMLFSALCDADSLESERFGDRVTSAARPNGAAAPSMGDLAAILDAHLAHLAAAAPSTPVNARRAEVLAACRKAADRPPGFFSLSVPTGGGKTLASLAFSLRHAARHGLRRVVTAIPFTSVIEQTAGVYRDVFAPAFGEERTAEIVLEHHSARDPEGDSLTARLAAENWDAPLVVTTNVQLFESLFAARKAACRKLHRLAGSVIVLDEAQTLPPDLLAPCLRALSELVEVYGCTVVLCTATQPALEKREEFSIGLENLTDGRPAPVREIVPAPAALHAAMRRVRCEWVGPLPDVALAERLAAEPQVLCVVNSRPHARELFEATRSELGDDAEGLIHLSTNLCAAHRAERFAEIRRRLAEGEPCRVVSTQLIEAGVDVDFPAVFRALCGLDSAAQAAGRCNREGRLLGPDGEPAEGVLTLFEPDRPAPPGLLASAAHRTLEVIATGDYSDLLSPDAVRTFFELHLWARKGRRGDWDAEKPVLPCFKLANDLAPLADYATADERFRMIPDEATPVFVPWGAEGERLIERLRRHPPDRRLLRKLRRYAVGVHDRNFAALVQSGDVERLYAATDFEGFAVLANPDLYDAALGLRPDQPGWYEPGTLVV
ncbi:CRISPR-associated endonuclease Cas3'' [Alienimonas californiensis]|uniref:DEAD/DEAH box helicase n=1 Tax=Alienimonas californiensis TaxID=2527989 RepID=A0A517PAL6_9PLAN|nr:CRISPR-associated endonuclease Cas3'' [Alienimonas californiensis]QDT16415.1 DEAD/DEAH box helicase [Alienimonas californiensis]